MKDAAPLQINWNRSATGEGVCSWEDIYALLNTRTDAGLERVAEKAALKEPGSRFADRAPRGP